MATANTIHDTTSPDLIDSFRAARLLDLPHASLMRLVKARAVPCYLLPGDAVKFDRAELRRWLQSRRQPAEVSAR